MCKTCFKNSLNPQCIELFIANNISCFKGGLLNLKQFLPNESPIKMNKNTFYLTLKIFSFSRYLIFRFDFLTI